GEGLKKGKAGVVISKGGGGGMGDEAGLAQALGAGRRVGAAPVALVDEPPQPDHPLRAVDSVICTPHLGASTEEAQEKVAIEVAEQMVAYFLRGEVRNAVNLPAIPRELRERLAPHVDLAEKLGALAGQLVGGNIDQIAIEVSGEPAEAGAKTVVAAALAGPLRPHLGVPVNEVNAPVLAADRGIRLSETRRARGENFASAVALRASGRGWSRYVMGTIFQIAERAEPRVVVIDDFLLEIAPEGRILV